MRNVDRTRRWRRTRRWKRTRKWKWKKTRRRTRRSEDENEECATTCRGTGKDMLRINHGSKLVMRTN